MRSTQRLYVTEGAVHIYSSLPTVLTPADLYRVRDNRPLREAIINCNIYLIVGRPRILIDPSDFSLDGKVLSGNFLVRRAERMVSIPFEYEIPPDRIGEGTIIKDVAVAMCGTHIVVIMDRGQLPLAAHILVASADTDLSIDERDLEVLYVGQAIGKSGNRSAVDRLLNHSTLQRILAEHVTFHPDREVLLLLYRFEHTRIIASTGGDMNADPTAPREEERRHLQRLGNIKLNRHSIVSLAEAGLIRHFQPPYNILVKTNDFAAKNKLSVLKKLLVQDITGLIVEIGSSNINSRLCSQSAPPPDHLGRFEPEVLRGDYLDTDEQKREWAEELHLMAHTQIAQFPLTNAHERDTFLHGMIWNGETERMSTI
ncbi:hypothetical protein [Burkholderia pyrrocinia]|uniref:hypothetical protein n=1 Tax=Burkholderia pyrrocinia TaxID=60550 RepID=UPI00104C44E6|nr:hypothetical protein [Burkholderia pyrrocinia]TDA46527.1 hypothetical protein EVG18_15870 [Burkholderia pyrrocinia]